METEKVKVINLCNTDIYFCTEEGEVIVLKSNGSLPLKVSRKQTNKSALIEGAEFSINVNYFSPSVISEMKNYAPRKEGVVYLVPPYIKHGVFPHRTDVVIIGSFEMKNGRKHATSLSLPQIEPRKYFKSINREIIRLASEPEKLQSSLVVIKKSIEPLLKHGKSGDLCQEK